MFSLTSVVVKLISFFNILPNKCCKTSLGPKMPPGVNFTNILRAAFLYESFLCSFYVLTIWACIFLQKVFGAKAAHKMLVKLTPGG
jgi:hypothetical protein